MTSAWVHGSLFKVIVHRTFSKLFSHFSWNISNWIKSVYGATPIVSSSSSPLSLTHTHTSVLPYRVSGLWNVKNCSVHGNSFSWQSFLGLPQSTATADGDRRDESFRLHKRKEETHTPTVTWTKFDQVTPVSHDITSEKPKKLYHFIQTMQVPLDPVPDKR